MRFSRSRASFILYLLSLLCLIETSQAKLGKESRVDWALYSSKHDLTWKKFLKDYFEGAFVGIWQLCAIYSTGHEAS